MADASQKKVKKSRKEKMAEQREFDRSLGLNKGIGGFKVDQVADRHLDDDRYERELAFKAQQGGDAKAAAQAVSGSGGGGQTSATFDAFMRMATGQEGRTIADKIGDSNRPTWDEYKKKNEDLLDMDGAALKKMAAYRKQLDEEREANLSRGKQQQEKDGKKRKGNAAISSSESEGGSDGSESDDSESDSDHKKKKHKKEKKKEKSKKSKKEKKRKKEKKPKKEKKAKKEEGKSFSLREFLNQSASDSD
jgi:outer membrane biosynthesis protein TonB